MEKVKVGYTTGVYDLFHIGHLNVLKEAKKKCDYLIVGVTTDEQVMKVKNKKTIISFEERFEIINALACVDKVVAEDDTNKLLAWEKYKFDVIFKGDDWKGTKKWTEYEHTFAEKNVEVVYFPYTKGTSSTYLREVLDKIQYAAGVSK